MHSPRVWPWLCGLAFAFSTVVQPTTAVLAAQTAPYCEPGESPAFQSDFAPLAVQLGAYMGDPVECEHPDPVTGDTLQTTTTGLAYLLAALNTPVFTDGESHVALTDQGLTGWSGSSVDAPLHLTLGGAYPTWCDVGILGAGVSGYVCIYAEQNVAAWSPDATASDWILLGTEASSDASWVLTAAGRTILGSSPPAATPPVSSMPPSRPRVPTPTPPPQPTPSVAPPLDSDLEVSIQPVSPSPPPSFPLVTGSVCNRSSVWTATNVVISFAFSQDPLTPTNDHGSYSVDRVPPNACQPIVASLSALYAWTAITPSVASVSWRR